MDLKSIMFRKRVYTIKYNLHKALELAKLNRDEKSEKCLTKVGELPIKEHERIFWGCINSCILIRLLIRQEYTFIKFIRYKTC